MELNHIEWNELQDLLSSLAGQFLLHGKEDARLNNFLGRLFSDGLDLYDAFKRLYVYQPTTRAIKSYLELNPEAMTFPDLHLFFSDFNRYL